MNSFTIISEFLQFIFNSFVKHDIRNVICAECEKFVSEVFIHFHIETVDAGGGDVRNKSLIFFKKITQLEKKKKIELCDKFSF